MNKNNHQIFLHIKQFMVWAVKVLTPLFEYLYETLANLLDGLLEQLAGKDHGLQGKFAPEKAILSNRYKGFNLTGKSISPQLSSQGVLINGNTGSGKSTIAVVRSVLTVDGSQIIHDPSKELFLKTSGALAEKGVTIIQIDFTNAYATHFYNPLHRANSLSQLNKLATQLMGNNSKSGGKDFWVQSAIGALVTIFRLVKLFPIAEQNLYNAAHLFDKLSDEKGRKEVSALIKTLGKEDPGLHEKYYALLGSGENTLPGILASAKTALQLFSLDENLSMITSKDSLGDLNELRKKKTAIFLHSSTTNGNYYAGITSIFMQQYFERFFKELPKKYDLPVYFHFDETPLLSGLKTLDLIAANCRKYGGNMMVICQNAEQQLTANYGREKAQSILSNLRTKVYLSASLSTAEQLEKQLGRYEYIEKKSERKLQRSLMTKDEIMCLPENKGLITITGQRPILAKLKPYYKVPSLLALTHIPAQPGVYTPDEDELLIPTLFDMKLYVSNWKKDFEEQMKNSRENHISFSKNDLKKGINNNHKNNNK